MAAWTTPKNDWQVNDIVTAPDLNIIADDLIYLKEVGARGKVNITPSTTASNVSFVTLVSLTKTTRGGDLLVDFYASTTHDSGGFGYWDVALDGVRVALNATNGSLELKPEGTGIPMSVSLSLLLEDVPAGAHTIALVWRTNAGNISVGYGQFRVVEIG